MGRSLLLLSSGLDARQIEPDRRDVVWRPTIKGEGDRNQTGTRDRECLPLFSLRFDNRRRYARAKQNENGLLRKSIFQFFSLFLSPPTRHFPPEFASHFTVPFVNAIKESIRYGGPEITFRKEVVLALVRNWLNVRRGFGH